MSRIKAIDMLVMEIKYKFKDTKKNHKEIQLLKQFVSNSDIFKGKRKSLYKKINRYKLK